MTDPRGPAGEDGFEMTFSTDDPAPPPSGLVRGGAEDGPAGRGPLRPGAIAGIAIGAFAVVLGLVLLLRQPESPPARGYDDATRAAFVDACADGGSDTARSVCECTYSTLTQRLPYDRFRQLDAAAVSRAPTTTGGTTPVQTTGGTVAPTTRPALSPTLPVDVRAIVAACIAQPSGPPGTVQANGSLPADPAARGSSTSVRPS